MSSDRNYTGTRASNILEADDNDLSELARQIKEGCTSGRLDNGEGKHIAWELKLEIWEDEDE